MRVDPKERRAARHAPAATSAVGEPARKRPITVERITDAALQVVASQGYDALTMRSVAALLNTGPASLYAHVVNKADIDELIIGRLSTELVLPEPHPALWREQVADVCRQLRDQYLRYPGIARAAMAMVVTNLDVIRVNEGLLSIVLAGGIAPQTAAWAIDALVLYVGAYTLEISLAQRPGDGSGAGVAGDGWITGGEDREELVRRFAALPEDRFPSTRRYAAELTSGTGHDRFDFTVDLIVANLA